MWIDDIEIPKCQHALPNALHLGVFKKSLSLGFSFQPGRAKYSHRTRICADVLSLSPKCCCWKLLTCWCKTTRPYLCKRVLPKFLEYILNLVKLVIWQPWRTAEARSHVLVRWITFQVCWNRSFQQAQQDKRCIVFGVVVELGTPRISNPTAFVACRSDHICRTHLATFEWAVYGGLAQHLKFCWLSICALAMGFAAEPRSVCYVWMLYRWKGDFGFLCLCRLTAKGSWKKVMLDWSIKIWCAWESRLCFANICIDFYPKMNGSGKIPFRFRLSEVPNLCEYSQQDW